MSEPPGALRLPMEMDLSLAAFSAAMGILTPTRSPVGDFTEVILMFGSGGFYGAHEIAESLKYTSGVMMTRHYNYRTYAEDEWSLHDRNRDRCVWCPGACG